MRQALITSLLSEVSDIMPDVNLQDLEERFVRVLDSWHVERTGTELVAYDPCPQALKDYLTTRAIEGLSRHTLEMYKRTLERFFVEVNVPFDRVDAVAVKVWLYGLKKRGALDTTQALYLTVIRTFFQWCVDNEYIQKNPCAKVASIKVERRRKHALTREELISVRSACSNLRERAIIELLYSTGCRVGEFVTIRRQDIDLAKGEIPVKNWKSKRMKTCYISESCGYWLKKYMKSVPYLQDVLFPSRKGGEPLSIGGVERVVKKIGERAGLATVLTPHILRHTIATDIVSNGGSLADAQHILDHVKPETTLIYAEMSKSQLQEVHRRCVA